MLAPDGAVDPKEVEAAVERCVEEAVLTVVFVEGVVVVDVIVVVGEVVVGLVAVED